MELTQNKCTTMSDLSWTFEMMKYRYETGSSYLTKAYTLNYNIMK